jgi:hypothetical protein
MISWLMLVTEVIAVYSDIHTRPIQNAKLLIVKAFGTYNYHWALKG